MQEIAERIYNAVVDEVTFKLSKKGYKVVISHAYPDDEDDTKYIIWQKIDKPINYIHFVCSIDSGDLELYYYSKKDMPDVWSAEWVSVYHDNIIYNYDELSEEWISEIIQEFVQEAIIQPNIIQHRATYKPPQIPHLSEGEKQAQRMERKSSWRIYTRGIAYAVSIIMLVVKLILFLSADTPEYPDRPDTNKHPTKAQIEMILQQYRVRNHDSVLMKDTSGVYYRYKKKLEAMNDTL